MAEKPPSKVPTDVALCAQCSTRYLPDPDQLAVLVTIGPLDQWARTIIRYAVEAGWQRRADEALVCPAHELSTARTP